MLHLVGQGTSGGSLALQGLYLYSSGVSGHKTNRNNFTMMRFRYRAHLLSTWLNPNRAAGLRRSLFSSKRVLKNKPCRGWNRMHLPTWKASWVMYVSLSHSNRPLVVYWKTEEVMLSIRLDTRCFRPSAGSAFRTAFWKTTLNAWGRTGAGTIQKQCLTSKC